MVAEKEVDAGSLIVVAVKGRGGIADDGWW